MSITRAGKTFPGYNKPIKSWRPGKKKAVLAKEGNKVKLLHFGDSSMTIKKDRPARKRSYCARSAGIKGANSKLSPNWWSRKAWACG